MTIFGYVCVYYKFFLKEYGYCYICVVRMHRVYLYSCFHDIFVQKFCLVTHPRSLRNIHCQQYPRYVIGCNAFAVNIIRIIDIKILR